MHRNAPCSHVMLCADLTWGGEGGALTGGVCLSSHQQWRAGGKRRRTMLKIVLHGSARCENLHRRHSGSETCYPKSAKAAFGCSMHSNESNEPLRVEGDPRRRWSCMFSRVAKFWMTVCLCWGWVSVKLLRVLASAGCWRRRRNGLWAHKRGPGVLTGGMGPMRSGRKRSSPS